MRQEIEVKKQAIRKNLEDISLFNQAMGQGDLPTTQLEESSGTMSINPVRKGVSWHKDTDSELGPSSTSVVSIKSIV